MPKIYPDVLPVFFEAHKIGEMRQEVYLPKVAIGELKVVGTQRRANALHVMRLPLWVLRGKFPTGQRYSYAERMGSFRVWRHSPKATRVHG